MEISVLSFVLTILAVAILSGLAVYFFSIKQDDLIKKEPSLKEIQDTLTYVKENFVTEGKTFDKVHQEFTSENEKCYNCSDTMRAFCIKRPHSEDCQGPYDW